MSQKLIKTLNHILKHYGHDIILQRRINDGFSSKLERHTVRHWYPGTNGLSHTSSEVPEGLINTVDLIYASRADMRPKEGDRIYEEDTSLGIQSVYKVDFAFAMRGYGGQIVYWLTGVTREEPS